MDSALLTLCDTTDKRFALPVVRGGRVYYGNGIRLAWETTALPDTVDGAPKDYAAIVQKFTGGASGWEPAVLPDAPPVVMIACGTCGGSGRVRATAPCSKCDGEGYATCDMGHEHKCETCHGDGYAPTGEHVPCETCGGAGIVAQVRKVVVCGVQVAYDRLAEVMRAIPQPAQMAQGRECVAFRFDGGGALVMMHD